MRRALLMLTAVCALVACAIPPRPTPDPTAAARPSPPLATVAPPQGAPSPSQGATPLPAPAADPTPSPAALEGSPSVDLLDQYAEAVPAVRDEPALARAFGRTAQDSAPRTAPLDVQLGDVEEFWVADDASGTFVRVPAELRYIGPVLLMYIDTRSSVDQAAVERSAQVFEQRIYPRNRALFGSEPTPGVDGDVRLTVLNTPLSGAGGYFSSADAVAGGANRFSNRREMFVMGINSFPVGTEAYEATLAHEFQHMIAWNQQRRRPAWLDEGLSTLAEDLNGYVSQSSATGYLADPDLQLTTWDSTSAHYGMSRLFLRYVHAQYTGDAGLSELGRTNAGNDLEAFARIAARRRADIGSFAALFGDWAVANLLNDPAVADGRFAYDLLPAPVRPALPQPGPTDVAQFGADYIGPIRGPATVVFDGAETVSLAGAPPAEGRFAWWSNRGDESVSTLTRELDLSGVSRATLAFRAWYAIETHYDYAYVTVSDDGGVTWKPLAGLTTLTDDPQGQSLGPALTGISGSPGAELGRGAAPRWVDEQFDLSPFAGKRVLLRFWLISDAAINGPGLLLDDIRVPEIGLSDGAEDGADGWQAEGFIRTSGALPQRWELRLVRYQLAGPLVESIALDQAGRATLAIPQGEQAVLVVSGATPHTTERATYTYEVQSP